MVFKVWELTHLKSFFFSTVQIKTQFSFLSNKSLYLGYNCTFQTVKLDHLIAELSIILAKEYVMLTIPTIP